MSVLLLDIPAYLTFRPRPNNPERFDEQEGFYYSEGTGVQFLLGGNGCCHKDQPVWDDVQRKWMPIAGQTQQFVTLGVGPLGQLRPQIATRAFRKGSDSLYRVTLNSGHHIDVTMGHRVLTPSGWLPLSELQVGGAVLLHRCHPDAAATHNDSPISSGLSCQTQCGWRSHQSRLVRQYAGTSSQAIGHLQYPHAFFSAQRALPQPETHLHAYAVPQYGHSGCGTVRDSQFGCPACHHSCDGLPLFWSNIDRYSSPSPVGVHEHIPTWLSMGGHSPSPEHTRSYQRLDHHSRIHCGGVELRGPAFSGQNASAPCSQSSAMAGIPGCQSRTSTVPTRRQTKPRKSPQQSSRCHTLPSSAQWATPQNAAPQSLPFSTSTIVSITPIGAGPFYDITCWPDHNYITPGGVINHNSGTTTALVAKICKFLMETPPPRRDTPFWIVAESYEQVCSMYDEKFWQQGHLPSWEVDRARIHWYKINNNWPFRVPLKCPKGSKCPCYLGREHQTKCRNWCLEFKSWRSGRGQMQARSLGGFGFIEQFPWGVFEEVLRGCREYNFPGSKLVEYTPVDPEMSLEIEEMLENGHEPEDKSQKQGDARYLPKNWEVFHANTACAVEQGHVDADWFREFFGMVPEDMLDTRMRGLFSSFEGVVYKDFNTRMHVIGDEMWARIRDCQHRRGIDWGAGPENDFVCLWAAKNSYGQWFVYDEYVSNDQSKTTVDHLTEVFHRWPWPKDDLNYGVTYADPSSPDNIRIAMKLKQYALDDKVDAISMSRGKNAVLEGIEHLQYLMKPQVKRIDQITGEVKLEPKLFIHRNCRTLITQLKTYRWMKGADLSSKIATNPRNARREPLKFRDHCCLTGDTLISMADGSEKPIADVQVGDLVLSHRGVSRVVESAQTGVLPTVEAEFVDTSVRCTADHPWFNHSTRQYSPLLEGHAACKLERTSIDPVLLSSGSTGMGRSGGDTPALNTSLSGVTSGDQHEVEEDGFAISGSIRKCGSRLMEISRRGCTSITLTAILPTITSTTCHACRPMSTCDSTHTNEVATGWRLQQSGTEALKEDSGIENTRNAVLNGENPEVSSASAAISCSQPLIRGERHDTAQTAAARAHGEIVAPTTRRETVSSAGSPSLSTNTRRRLPVLLPVEIRDCLRVRETGDVEAVFNLTTEDGTYFANGILSSNCDALRYVCFTEDSRSGGTIESRRSQRSTHLDGHIPSGNWTDIITRHRERGGA